MWDADGRNARRSKVRCPECDDNHGPSDVCAKVEQPRLSLRWNYVPQGMSDVEVKEDGTAIRG